MNVEKTGNLPQVQSYNKAQKVQQVKPTLATTGEDHVQISSQAQEMFHKVSQAAVRQEKVTMIKQQIEEGTYKIDTKKIATDISDFWFGKQGESK